jgi:putative dimethyl sulfoxide reductase chaperone
MTEMNNDYPFEVRDLDARAALYGLLSRLYTYPLDTDVLGQVLALRVEGEEYIPQTLDAMKLALGGRANAEALVEELNLEATRLFEGPGRPAAPPFGSYYLNEGRLMGPEAIAVRGAYLAERLLPQESRVPPDHLLLELGFMAALARLAQDKNAEEPLLASRRFLAEHILTWLPYWRHDVEVAEPHPFYTRLGDFTIAVLERDLEWLDDVLGLQEHRDPAGLDNPGDIDHDGPLPAPPLSGALEGIR